MAAVPDRGAIGVTFDMVAAMAALWLLYSHGTISRSSEADAALIQMLFHELVHVDDHFIEPR